MMIKRIGVNCKGSVTIEAALILPIIISVFVFGFSLMHMTFIHAKLQNHLNQLCIDTSYSSYILQELDILDRIQELYQSSKNDALTYEEMTDFIQGVKPIMQSLKSSSAPQQDNLWMNIAEPFAVTQKNGDTSFDALLFMERVSDSVETYQQMVELSDMIPSTIKTESIYFLTSQLGRNYFQTNLEEYCNLEKIDIDVSVTHCEMFFENDTGKVIIEYMYELPVGIGIKKNIKLSNSAYMHVFGGSNTLVNSTIDDLSESDYGSTELDNTDNQTEDQNGCALKVYITTKGTKYHNNPLCFHIKVDPYPMMLGPNPKKKPCDFCAKHVSVNPSMMVYSTNSSNVYHTNQYCHAIYHEIKELTEKEAIVKGYAPCGTCNK